MIVITVSLSRFTFSHYRDYEVLTIVNMRGSES